MSAGTATRPALTLVPPQPTRPPAPSRLRRARSWWWKIRNEATFQLRYRFLSRLADRVATDRQRERAWLAGFEFGLRAYDREPFWPSLLSEYHEGNEDALAARSTRWIDWGGRARTQARTRRRTLLARLATALPVSRGRVASETASQAKRIAGLVIAAMDGDLRTEPVRGAPLFPVNPDAWKDGA